MLGLARPVWGFSEGLCRVLISLGHGSLLPPFASSDLAPLLLFAALERHTHPALIWKFIRDGPLMGRLFM